MSAATSTSPKPRATLAGDAWGGFASMLVALPAAIAYGVAVFGVLGADHVAHGVKAGIVGATVLGIIAAAVGGAPQLISAPCAPAAAVLTAELLEVTGSGASPNKAMMLLTLVVLGSAGLQILYGAIGGGRLIKYIPYPVVSGYLSAVGVIIFAGQLPNFLGLASGHSSLASIAAVSLWQWPALLVGAATVLGVLLAPRITKLIPPTIVGLAIGIGLYFALGTIRPDLLQLAGNTLVIGPVGSSLPDMFGELAISWSAVRELTVADWRALLVPALTLSVLLSVDTLKTCVVVDALDRSRHDSNRTLVAQGAGNLAAAFFGGMPGAGTMGPTLVNIESGGRTARSGLIEGSCVLLAALLLGRWIAWVPVAALAGILLVVAARMIDWRCLQLARQRETALDFAVIATVVVVAVSTNLIAASGAGVALAIVLFIREQARGTVIRRRANGRQISSTQHRLPEETAVLERQADELLVCELQGNLFFGTTDKLLTELEPALESCRFLVLDLRRVQSVDYTAVHLLERFERSLAARGGWLLFSRVPKHLPTGRNLRAYVAQLGVVGSQHHLRVFASLDDALAWVEDRLLETSICRVPSDAPPLPLAEFDLVREFEAEPSLAALAACVAERTCKAGEPVFRSGALGSDLYLVRNGIVRVSLPLKDGSHHNLSTFGRGNFFGEMAFLTRSARSADAVALTECSLFVISRERFDEVSRAHPIVGVKMFARIARTLALRLRRTDAELRAIYEN